MASPVGVKLEVNVSVLEKAKQSLLAKPAKVRRVVRNALARTTRASARRVKANVSPNKRTGRLQKSEGSKVVTFKDVVVGLVGARKGFRSVEPGLGSVDPSKYDHLVERGRKTSRASAKGGKFLALRFRNLTALFKFLDGKFGGASALVPPSRKPAVGRYKDAGMRRVLRKYGRRIADLVRPNQFAPGGYVVFLRKVGPAPAYNPVFRDENNFIRESEQAVSGDLASKLG